MKGTCTCPVLIMLDNRSRTGSTFLQHTENKGTRPGDLELLTTPAHIFHN